MHKLLASLTAGASLLFMTNAALADGYYGGGPRAYAHPFTWTGCYIGANAGYGWGDKKWTDPALANFEFSRHDVTGGLVGGQVGCDVQTGLFVFGVEGSASWADITGSSFDTLSPGGVTLRDHSKIDFIGTIAGRAGLAFGRSLAYVKGGWAFADDKFRATCSASLGACTGIPVGTLFYKADDHRDGWMLGAGLEHSFGRNWSAKVEYNFMDFGRDRESFRGGLFAGTAPFDIDQHVHVVKLGINYRFGVDEYRPLK